MITPAEAQRLILESVVPFHREDCPIAAAHGRVLRANLTADRDLPPYDRVTLDGYAVRAGALAAGQRSFVVQGVQAAGMRAFRLGDGPDACIEAMTGAVLPEGADCVIPYEDTRREGDRVVVPDAAAAALKAGNAVHRRGGDLKAGDLIVRSGTRLGGREIAVAAACGHTVLTVAQQPKIAIVATGDELVEVGMPVAAHQIRRSNDYALAATLAGAGYAHVERHHLRDVPHEIEAVLRRAVGDCDAVIVIGGVSKGKFDHVPPTLERLGVVRKFHGVAQRPGKPMWFGVGARHTLVFALPGNPVSCYTCLHRYVLPALTVASGAPAPSPARARLGSPVTFTPKLAYLLPVSVTSDETAALIATPEATNTSGDFAGLVGTDGFVELPADRNEFPAGFVAPFWRWS